MDGHRHGSGSGSGGSDSLPIAFEKSQGFEDESYNLFGFEVCILKVGNIVMQNSRKMILMMT